jgi:ParB family chromosome partitioning protein
MRIKIGFARDYLKRYKDHTTPDSIGRLAHIEQLAVVAGDGVAEKCIHRYFADYAWNGQQECFLPDSPVVDYVRWLRHQWFCWVPERLDKDGQEETVTFRHDDLAIVDQSEWLPNHTRAIAPSRYLLSSILHGPLNLPLRQVTCDDYYTNPIIIDAARSALGGTIDLDPASHPIANKEVRASKIYTKQENGLLHPWAGKVWVNPPFSHWKEWAPKIAAEWQAGRISEMCVLAACRTLTALHFTGVHKHSSAMCVLRGRIPFIGDLATSSPDDGHVVFYFGPNLERFRGHFQELGTVYKK